MSNELKKHIENINNLFWDTGDLDLLEMFSLIVSKKFILEYGIKYPLQKPSLEIELKKIDLVQKECYKDIPTMPEWLKKELKETPLTIKNAEKLLKIFIETMRNKASMKVQLRILEQKLLGRYE